MRQLLRVWAAITIIQFVTVDSVFGQTIYQQAAGHLQQDNPRAALDILDPVLEQQPNDMRALVLRGMALTALGRLPEANTAFERALSIDSGFVPALRGLGMNEIAAGNTVAAKKHFNVLLEVSPSEPLAHLALAEISYGERDLAACLEHFVNSQGLYLKDPRLILKFADAAIQSKQPSKAEEALILMPASADPDQHLQAGLMLARLEKYSSAVREFQLARAGKDAYLAGYNLALAELKASDPEASIRTVAELTGSGLRTSELLNLQGQAFEKLGRTADAYEALRTATTIDPGDETNYLDLIALCLDHKNLDQALEITDIALRRLPKSDRLQLQKGVVWAMKGDFDQAKPAFAEASRLAPEKSLPHVALGLVLLQMDQTDEAISVLRRTSKSGQDQYLLDWFLAEALSRAGVEPGSAQEKEAVAALENTIRQRPDLAQPHVLMGKLQLRRGNVDRAVAELERALQIEPKNTTATYQLGQAYRKKGDTKRAAELFAKVSKEKNEEREELTRKGLQLITEGSK